MKRLFLGLWPDNTARQQCVTIGNAVLTENARPVQAADIHVTLLFLGNIDSDTEESLKQGLAVIPAPEMTLCFDYLSFWEKPGILCLTTSGSYPEAKAFVEVLTRLAKKLDIPIDERPFKPHITLVKKAKTQALLEFDPIIWHSNSFCLVESCQFSNGIKYRIVEEWGGHKI